MNVTEKAPNRLINERSPYLLQHAYNPVDWFPWGEEAFAKARAENKPVFLSIGYSTCHWCHVMERESFGDESVAKILNDGFVSIKVDKEERPDIDSVYMNVCQAVTGSGGWPLTTIMTHEQKPFFSGTYFPKNTRRGSIGLIELLLWVREKWIDSKNELFESSNALTKALSVGENAKGNDSAEALIDNAVEAFKSSFDKHYGGFNPAPKFPSAHNLLFLLHYYEVTNDKETLQMAEKTLLHMAKGGIFDHIGFGFSRYATDKYWLVPHFEKMLYDNALLVMAYLKAYEITQNALYKAVAVKTMDYVLRELTDARGAFYSAQDADSDGVEGKYYVFTPAEIVRLLGEKDGGRFNAYFNITEKGNFEGRNIPNLIHHGELTQFDEGIEPLLPLVYGYRKDRTTLRKDDKILTSWNGLMISAYGMAYRILREDTYLKAAQTACAFIDAHLSEGGKLFVSFRNDKQSGYGFLDDYAFYIYAQISLYEATLENRYLTKAVALTQKVIADFFDKEGHGFYLYGKDSEALILKPKETYDGAMPSGNSVMAYNLLKLSALTEDEEIEMATQKQFAFMAAVSGHHPSGYCFFMLSLLLKQNPGKKIVCVLKHADELASLKAQLLTNATIIVLNKETREYPLKNDMTTFYVCQNNSCQPPVNVL